MFVKKSIANGASKRSILLKQQSFTLIYLDETRNCRSVIYYYNMTVWIWAGNNISFTIAAGLIRLHMPGVKKSRV